MMAVPFIEEHMTVRDLSRRLEKLEHKVEELARIAPRTGAWYLQRAGQFANDPIYDEIARRGRAYRRSLRPKSHGKNR
jgi:hypothetical protein